MILVKISVDVSLFGIVGISWSTSDASLQDTFRKYGDVIEGIIFCAFC